MAGRAGSRTLAGRVVLAMALVWAPAAFTQAPRDVPAATGPIVVTGRVITGEAATPLRRVLVSFGGDASTLPVHTDDDGAFQVVVARGTGGLRLTKPGYAPLTIERRALRTGTQLLIQMARGAAVTGVVTDHLGGPAVNVQVRVRRVGANGTFTTETDDQGEFRVGNLEAGRYTVEATTGGGRGRGAAALLGRLDDNQRAELRSILDGASAGGVEPAGVRSLLEGVLAPERTNAQAGDGTQTDGRGRGGRGGRGGGGRGRGGRGAETPDPALPTVEVAEGQEASVALSIDTQTAADLELALTTAVTVRPAAGQQQATGELRGRVYDGDGRPLRRATVQITPVGAAGTRRSAVTDANGYYEMTGLAPGAYRARISRSGLPDVEYGQKRALQAGRIITVAANQRVQGIDVRMPKANVITGTLLDAWGDPIEGASVTVLQASYVSGRTTLGTVSGSRTRRTDDRGRYRIYALLPGRYYVVASEPSRGRGGEEETSARVFYPGTLSPSSSVPVQVDVGQDAFGVDFTFSTTGAARVEGFATSVVTGEASRGRATLAVSQRSGEPLLPLQTTRVQDDGSFVFTGVSPGDYVVQVVTTTGGRGNGGRGGRGGNADGGRGRGGNADAGRGGGNAGRGGGNAGFGGGNTGRGGGGAQQGGGGRGRATGAQPGTPAGVPQGAGGGARGGGAGQVGGGGTQGRGTAQTGRAGNVGGNSAALLASLQAAPSREFGMAWVTVDAGDAVAVQVETSPGVFVSGQLALEGDTSSVSPTSFSFAAHAADADTAPLSGSRETRAQVLEDWTFALQDLLGPHQFAPTRAPDGWWLKSVYVHGINAVEQPVTFHRSDSATTDVVVTFAQGTGAIEGQVLNDRREPTGEFAVVVFASDPNRWFSNSQYLRFSTPTQDGTFSVTGLPPGEYFVAALDRIEGGPEFGEWQNPVVLNALVPSARRFTLGAGQVVTTELRMLRAQ